MATIQSYQTKSDKKLCDVTHRTPNGRATRSRRYETQCTAKEFASNVEVPDMRGANIGELSARDTTEN